MKVARVINRNTKANFEIDSLCNGMVYTVEQNIVTLLIIPEIISKKHISKANSNYSHI